LLPSQSSLSFHYLFFLVDSGFTLSFPLGWIIVAFDACHRLLIASFDRFWIWIWRVVVGRKLDTVVGFSVASFGLRSLMRIGARFFVLRECWLGGSFVVPSLKLLCFKGQEFTCSFWFLRCLKGCFGLLDC